MQRKRVVVLGAGFAGLHAVRVLSGRPDIEVVLVDRNNYHLFQPLLYQVATAGLEAPQIAFPIRAYLRRRSNVRFLLGRAEGADLKDQVLWVEGRPLPYDYLIIGTGSRTHDFGLPGVAQHALGLKTLDEAMRIRDRILSACEEAERTQDPERRRALLTFVVVGGGPTGVELAGALGELRRHVIARDYPSLHPSEVRIALVESAPHLLGTFKPGSRTYAQRFLERLGVELRLGERVVEVTPQGVRLHSGTFIPSHNVIWSAGVSGHPLPGLPTTRGQRVATTPALFLPEAPSVYVVGDLNYLEGPDDRPYPQVAPAAMQQGAWAARNILRSLRKEPQLPFRYKDKGSMVTLGRSHAIAEVGPLRIYGFPAWGAWLGVHLYYLVGLRNRLMVFSNWAYSYLTYDFAVRVMHHRHSFAEREGPSPQVLS
ncbi:NADH dehydrogenase-like protein [Meiothermus luteus]|uniref:NADH:ubiquinone reductase (non-electrogenic) n=1 Tax=Meiothermus luteus TaxID=2026184 RepID=A0A399ERV1_9DEIN|nr:NAD(P)/FAD-dependent oxidoreductase [Meiothermus luteus]RIH85292.1 NADH dehydrogenase-like protein [Meiothermus luteus]RMH53793.1 MAG: NAD(P)/FAD-dependent oxidoreductase [Deinococcota bacterium]